MDIHEQTDKYRVGVLEKSLLTIEKLVEYPNGVALRDLSRETGLNKSTLYRILYTLQLCGYISAPQSGVYKLNYKFASIFRKIPDVDLQLLAARYLPALAQATGKTPYFYVRDGDYSVCIAKYDEVKNRRIKLSVDVGERTFLHSTSGGKIFLAAMSEEKLEQWSSRADLIPRTVHTITDYATLHKDIQQVRRLGYSVNNIENEENVISVAAPVHDHNGHVVAAVNSGDTILDFKPEAIPEVAKIVIQYAAA